jgi:hypothetical protein
MEIRGIRGRMIKIPANMNGFHHQQPFSVMNFAFCLAWRQAGWRRPTSWRFIIVVQDTVDPTKLPGPQTARPGPAYLALEGHVGSGRLGTWKATIHVVM